MPPNSIPLQSKLVGYRTVGPRGGALDFNPYALDVVANNAARAPGRVACYISHGSRGIHENWRPWSECFFKSAMC